MKLSSKKGGTFFKTQSIYLVHCVRKKGPTVFYT